MEPEKEQAYDLMGELTILNPTHLRICADAFGDLTLEMQNGEVHTAISPVLAFPITTKSHFIILKDKEGEELGIIQNADDLDSKSLNVLNDELKRVYFTPKIILVNAIEERNHIPKWDVETDRGPRVFEIRTSRDVRVLGDGRILIRDADGNRYEIPDYRKLDNISQAIVETQI